MVLHSRSCLGSSPHTWRIREIYLPKKAVDRIISTYVENTGSQNIHDKCMQDHLHIRGEYNHMVLHSRSCLGSSPHTWRIQEITSDQCQKLRIISTYVENTSVIVIYKRKLQDHLHIRGEYGQLEYTRQMYVGSSPHTWRIQSHGFTLTIVFRIISTYVENTIQYVSVWQY